MDKSKFGFIINKNLLKQFEDLTSYFPHEEQPIVVAASKDRVYVSTKNVGRSYSVYSLDSTKLEKIFGGFASKGFGFVMASNDLLFTSGYFSDELWRSEDHGSSWNLSMKLPSRAPRTASIFKNSLTNFNGFLVAGVYSYQPTPLPRIYVSEDRGLTWSLLYDANQDFPHANHCHCCNYDPYSERLFCSFGDHSRPDLLFALKHGKIAEKRLLFEYGGLGWLFSKKYVFFAPDGRPRGFWVAIDRETGDHIYIEVGVTTNILWASLYDPIKGYYYVGSESDKNRFGGIFVSKDLLNWYPILLTPPSPQPYRGAYSMALNGGFVYATLSADVEGERRFFLVRFKAVEHIDGEVEPISTIHAYGIGELKNLIKNDFSIFYSNFKGLKIPLTNMGDNYFRSLLKYIAIKKSYYVSLFRT
jgi:hypothetical protein